MATQHDDGGLADILIRDPGQLQARKIRITDACCPPLTHMSTDEPCHPAFELDPASRIQHNVQCQHKKRMSIKCIHVPVPFELSSTSE